MVKVTHICTECAEVITDPLCVSCFEKEAMAWLADQELSLAKKLELKERVLGFIGSAKQLSFSYFRCVVCNGKMQNICNYCMMKNTAGIMKEFVSEEETGQVFNYEIHDFGLQRGGPNARMF